jgi:glutamate N-acetyltransferase / amino-acid N-acetyltransferase
MHDIAGGIAAPTGFTSAGIHCGVKKAKKDLSLVYSSSPATGAAVFTTNKVQAAPVLVDRSQLDRSPSFRAILINSGNANACTGDRGMEDAWAMVRTTASALSIKEAEVLVSSTGVIGQYLPIEKILAGAVQAVPLLEKEGTAAAEAIRTTDTFTKETAVEFTLGGVPVRIGGMAKGSGMIAPNMATMLAFVTTDAKIDRDVLQHTTRLASDRSFNRISVDGDTSTNDMVLVLANGMAGNTPIDSVDHPFYKPFYHALEEVLIRLSKMIVMDGEGATKFIEIRMTGAATEAGAAQAARAVANSNLVKTAIHGEDANWGRILAAVGYSGIDFDPAAVEIQFGDVPILRRNYVIDFSEEQAKAVLMRKEIIITVNLHQGTASAVFWTCDLSKEYVTINANYRT